ncbi:MAG: hypothetical protein DRI36_01500 [Caldiserica bacterium]|nr:MAG: hypothetical protein DRI36_01500 [Caldisericota bacterium]
MKVLKFFLIVFIFIGLSIGFIIQRNSTLFKKISRGERVNFLVLGTDELKYGRHADTIILVSYEPKTKFFDVLSIPRDTYVGRIKWRRRKLSEVLFLSLRKRKDLSRAVLDFTKRVEKIVSMDIDFYFVVTYEGFKDLIDTIGRIKVYIPFDMDYDDNWGNLHIHFKKGWHNLNGEDALKYIRFRKTALGDKGRIMRQQEFLKLVIKKGLSINTVFKIPDLIEIFKKKFLTNLSIYDMIVILNEARFFDFKNLRFQLLSGEPRILSGKDFLILDEEKKEEMVDVIKNSWRVNWPRPDKRIKIKRIENEKESLIVDVWNATKRSGLAERVSKILRYYGIDVLEWGNWGRNKRYSMVVARTGDLKKAHRIAKILDIKIVKTDIDKTRMVDCSIVLGEDFKFDEEGL